MDQRRKILFDKSGVKVSLSYYKAEDDMQLHDHDHLQVSWLLSGDLLETSRAKDREILMPSVGIKPAGFVHANNYGRHGSLILTVGIKPGSPYQDIYLAHDDWHWSPFVNGNSPSNLPILLSRLIDQKDSEAEAALWDLLALSNPAGPSKLKEMPSWLSRVKDQLRDVSADQDLAALANEAGVHRVYLSRIFTACFGVPPSVYRARCRVAKAMSSVFRGEPLIEAALGSGFADQSHFNRQVKSQTGFSPRSLHQLVCAS